MGLRDIVRNWINQPIQGITPPQINNRALAGGRISKDRPQQALGWGTAILPPPDYESDWRALTLDDRTLARLTPTRLLQMMADLSPEVSSALWYFLRLCNPGWEAEALRPNSETQDKRAQRAIDDFMDLLDDQYGAVDVVFNRLFMATFLRGAALGELVLNRTGKLPVDIATPDPITIRFKEMVDEDRGLIWVPGQWQSTGFVTFEDETIRYLPVDPFPGSPYGRPLVSPALFTSLFLLSMMHDLKRVIQQQGYPRLDIAIDFAALAESMPDEAHKSGWADAVRTAVENAYAALEPDDAFVHDANITINRPIGAVDADSLGAVDALIQALERMAARALKTMPLLMGITESTSETQANRQFEIQAAGIKSIQHLVENLMERLLKLALEVQGIQADIAFRFAEIRAAEELRDAQTLAMQIANAKALYDHGYTSQDESSEMVTGHPADAPEPRVSTGGIGIVQGDGDGEEALNQGSDRKRGVRAPLIPDGADLSTLDVPDVVIITAADVDAAIDAWDETMPEYAGLLEATIEEEDRQRGVRVPDAPSPWVWEQNTKRYRNTQTGQFVGNRQMVQLRDRFIDAQKDKMDNLATRLANKEIALRGWESGMRSQIRQTFIDQYVLGKGGRNRMTQADWGRVGRMARTQYEYASQFARDIADGKLSEAAIASRSKLYVESSSQAFERGQSASYGGFELPAYPGDGQTVCRSNCKCHWNITETDESWECRWALSGNEHCPDCVENGANWNPLVVLKAGRSRSDLEHYLKALTNGHRTQEHIGG